MRRAILFIVGLALLFDAWIFSGFWCVLCALTLEAKQ